MGTRWKSAAAGIRAGALRAGTLLMASGVLAACADSSTALGQDRRVPSLRCSIPETRILPGGPGKDGIPALTDPAMVPVGDAGLGYLADADRVIGFERGGRVYGIPLNVMWWHEIVNLRVDGVDLAITHCPLTGSTLAFDRSAIGGAELGVSGLLYLNNLLMYDRTGQESLWPQMLRSARCGPRDGTMLEMVPVMEMEWREWRRRYPHGVVVSAETGHDRDYTRYPYGDYDEVDNGRTLFAMPTLDTRRPPKERVLGIPDGDGGLAIPFGALDAVSEGGAAVVTARVDGRELVVFWDGAGRAAMAYEPVVDGEALTFRVEGAEIRDMETGSAWAVEGRAMGGPLAGTRLRPHAEAFVAYWFAWAAFYPEAELWAEATP